MRFAAFLFLALSLAFGQNQNSASKKKSDVLYSFRNPKYHLVCKLHGSKEIFEDIVADHFKYATVSDERTGDTALIKIASDEPGESGLYYSWREIGPWSPDDEWLVIPINKFNGMWLARAKNALVELRSKHPLQFNRFGDHGIWLDSLGMWTAPASLGILVGVDDADGRLARWGFIFNLTNFSMRVADHHKPTVADSFSTTRGEYKIPWEDPHLLDAIPNPKYHLICQVYGVKNTFDSTPGQDEIDYLMIMDEQTKETVKIDNADTSRIADFHKQFWSADGEWLVLPDGDRFRLLQAGTAMADLKDKKDKQYLSFRLAGSDSNPMLSPRFTGWTGPSSFEIKATGGPEGHWEFLFDLNDFSMTRTAGNDSTPIEYLISKGRTSIPIHQ